MSWLLINCTLPKPADTKVVDTIHKFLLLQQLELIVLHQEL